MSSKELKACRKCRLLVKGNNCPACQGTDLSPTWAGLVEIIDLEKSEVAKKMKASVPGKYALKVR
ncbi:MAG TPA: hypothetical protein ENN60_00100 [archaeon]|nr:hypothetical protein [archaeon]